MTLFQKIILSSSLMMTLLAGCAATQKPSRSVSAVVAGSGGYYQDDGPADAIPVDLDKIPDAAPKLEVFHRFANRPYTVMGQSYEPAQKLVTFTQRGNASWYGKKFHGRKTASGEVYDMFAMTAAHRTLPIPSYVRVVNPANGRQVVVRVNDRGPFHNNRIIDLSYSAAHRLGFVKNGYAHVEVEQILFDDEGRPLIDSITPLDVPIDLAPTSDVLGGAFVQVGAYRVRDNADIMSVNLKNHFGELDGKTQIVLKNDLFRVWIGPFESRLDAIALADQISDRYGFKVAVVDQ